MVLEAKLIQFFDTPKSMQQQYFPDDIRDALVEVLNNSSVFKARRMSLLIMQSSFTNLEWLEWFNWYYVVSMKTTVPDWLKLARESVALAENINLMTYDQFLQDGWNIKDVVISSVFLSDSGIANYHANDNEIEHWCRLRSKNLNLFSGAVLAGELIGQVGFIKLDSNEYRLLRSGKLAEKDIRSISEEYSGPVYLYIPSVVLKPEWRKKSVLFKLFNHLNNQLDQQPELQRRVKGLIALAYTDDGAALCERFNFKLVHKMYSGERVFIGALSQLLTYFKRQIV